jgi:plastocyanin
MKAIRVFGMLLMISLAVAIVAACGGDDEGDSAGDATATAAGDEESPGAGDGDSVELEITALDTAYDEEELSAPAGAAVSLIFDNDDDGLLHNWSLYESEDATEAIFEGERITGVEQITYEFDAPEEPGTYHFHCDVHPTQMTGEFIVE